MMKFVARYILDWILIYPFLSTPVLANPSQSQNYRSINTIPEPGWTVWRPKSEIPKADFSSGFSNLELGGYMDFENACTQDSGVPKEEISYWFRLTHSLNRIGTGKVEYGCWVKGRFLHKFPSTAIKSSLKNVTCLRVNSPIGNGLVIRSQPQRNSSRLGVVANGQTVTPDGFPPVILGGKPRNWVAITAPIKGWVSDGSPTSRGNLRLC